MAQADGVVANGTGSAVRADINGQLAALFTNHSGSTEPSTTFAFQTWADTNTNTLKLRNSSNDGWVQLARLDGQFDAKTFNSNVTLNAQSDLRFADSDSSNWVAFQAPATVASNVTWTLPSADGTADQALTTNGSGVLSWADAGGVQDNITEGNTSAEVVDTGSDGHFKVVTEGTERLRVGSSGQLGIAGENYGTSGQVLTSQGSGSAPQWSTIASDSISEGNTTVECVDTGSDGHITFSTEGTEVARIDSSSHILVGTTSPRTVGFWDTIFNQIEGPGYQQAGLLIYQHANDIYPAVLGLGKTRGTTAGSNTIVQNGDQLGAIAFYGSDGSQEQRAAEIGAFVDGTPGSNDMPTRLVFKTTPDGANNPTERFRLQSNGVIGTGSLYNRTTAVSANVYVDSGTDLYRSTSSIKYKTDVEDLQDSYADAILNVRPVWYRSTCENDCHEHSWWGFIAEEVADIDPRLVHWKTHEITYDEEGSIVPEPCEPEADGVAYERFVPHLLNLIKRQKEQLETQAASIASLEARLAALEGGA